MGGWATVKTQDTRITPATVKTAVIILEKIFTRFNSWSTEQGLKSLALIGPGGSGSHYLQDLVEYPEKTYGDIDIVVAYPLSAHLDRREELDVLTQYNSAFLRWAQLQSLDELDSEETVAISQGSLKMVINLEEGPIQIDVISTFEYAAEWTKARYTPIRGTKGFVVGYLYQSLGNALNVSITDRGVIAKIRGDVLVGPMVRKGVEERIISREFDKFIAHLAEFTDEFNRGEKIEVHLDSYLADHPGIEAGTLSLEQICNGILGLARTLEKNETFKLPNLEYNSANDFLTEVVRLYREKLEKHTSSSKFKKARTLLANQQFTKVINDAGSALSYVSAKLV